jgi:ElaB/YqjD/DUF883 family membrane-anchored ribosome-binding protein
MGEATDKIMTANQSADNYDDPEQLRAEIEDTRAEMSQTINEIQERLSPENVMDQVKEKVREATIGKVERVMNRVGETIGEVAEPAREVVDRAGTVVMETGRSAADVVWRNPIPVALIGLGLGMIAMRAFRGGNGYDYEETKRSAGLSKMHDMPTTGTLNRVKGTASDLAHRSTETLNNLGTKAKDTASSLGTRVEHMFRENPLAIGAVAVAAGTAVGLMLPATKFESEYIGETSERLVDKAQEVARETIDKVQNAAQHMTEGQQPQ